MNVHAPDCPQAQRCTCPVSKERSDCLFAVTADQLLQLADLCGDAAKLWRPGRSSTAQKMAEAALRWEDTLRREHAAHLSEEANSGKKNGDG